ncbi:MAG: type II secretion system protein GspM [Actinomycetota bacterium]
MIAPVAMRRAAAVGLLGLVLAAAWLLLLLPLAGLWTEQADALADARLRLDRLTALAGAAAALDAALAERRQAGGQGQAWFDEGSDTLVAAVLQDRIKAAVEQAGATLASVRVLPAVQDGPFRRVAVRAQIEATLAPLQRSLWTLEAGRPYLVLDNLSVRALRQAADPPLTVQVDVAAFARGAAP